MNKTPALFLGHGSPMNAIEADNPFNRGFRQVAVQFPKPRAILMISAHWYSDALQVSGSNTPGMIYDFYGFPEELNQVQYPAPGSPELAAEVQRLLDPEPVSVDNRRGFDHGTWSVLKHLYPDADIPVVQLSLNRHRPAEWHFTLAQKLKPLREQGVLIVGSGNIVHNLRTISFAHIRQPGAAYEWAETFRRNINQAILHHDTETLIHYPRLGEAAALSAPTPEHYLPLLYIMALRDDNDEVQLFNDEIVGGSLSMTSVLMQ
ncbi:4,5-DOPA dioxygenase extradiol [Neisseria wadsworthii]|uniref:Extradiol-type ring-opening dioxygenase n=1 Tax=Neisseria wadsworthii 9715 TaxID=1030841 RepID=G4CLX7_9NEIS|nr:4,5-DOPA dioxygenase extradiol [Neisseria wadsworthii]EGZ51335.1 extradiol-type ring-opening dioxygenase [Neisseria wadsworthii 9715]QMT36153.1 4,5-DOPA dioxygenase extradiol [Neisseria wadsworthii]